MTVTPSSACDALMLDLSSVNALLPLSDRFTALVRLYPVTMKVAVVDVPVAPVISITDGLVLILGLVSAPAGGSMPMIMASPYLNTYEPDWPVAPVEVVKLCRVQ